MTFQNKLILPCLISLFSTFAIAQPEEPKLTARYTSTWSTVVLSSSAANRANPLTAQEEDRTSLAISAQIDISEIGNLVALDQLQTVRITRIIDGEGRDRTEALSKNNEPEFLLLTWLRYRRDSENNVSSILEPYRVSPELRTDHPLPRGIRSLKGTVRALIAGQTTHRDFPFRRTKEPIEIIPGYRCMIHDAVEKQGKLSFRIAPVNGEKQEYDFEGKYSANDRLPPAIITRMQFLDANGDEIQATRSAIVLFNPAGMVIGGHHTGGKIATIRFIIATDPAVVELPFELTDIRLPDLSNIAVEK